MSTADAQNFLGVKRYTFEHHIRPKIETIKIGRKIFFKRVELERVVGQNSFVDGGPQPETIVCTNEAQSGTFTRKSQSARSQNSYEKVREKLLKFAHKPSVTIG